MKLLLILAVLVLVLAVIVAGVVSLVAGGEAGLTSGAVLIGLFLLLLVAIIGGLFWLKRKLKSALRGLADAAQAGTGSELPEVITMQTMRIADEGFDTEKIDGLSDELRRLGYQEIGEFKILELSVKPCIRAFLNPANQTYAVVYHAEGVSQSSWVDVVSRFGESNALTTTTAAMAGLLNKPPKLRTQKFPDASMTELVGKHNERVAQIVAEEAEQPEPLTTEGFVERFLAAYQEERRFREAQGGPTEEEVRRVAAATPDGGEKSDEVILAATDAMRAAHQANAGAADYEREAVEPPNFEEAAKQPGFQQAVEEAAQLCGCDPEPFDPVPGGVIFQADEQLAQNILTQWHPRFLERNCYLFCRDQSSGVGGQGECLALLPTAKREDVIRAMGTDGGNCEVDTEDIIRWLNELETEQPFLLTGIGTDFLEGRFTTPIRDAQGLAKRMYEFCPDIVEQGTDSVEALAGELRKTQRLYLWWD